MGLVAYQRSVRCFWHSLLALTRSADPVAEKGTLLARPTEQSDLENRRLIDGRVKEAFGNVPDSEMLALSEIPLLPEHDADDGASSNHDDDEVSESPGYLALTEMARGWAEPLKL